MRDLWQTNLAGAGKTKCGEEAYSLEDASGLKSRGEKAILS